MGGARKLSALLAAALCAALLAACGGGGSDSTSTTATDRRPARRPRPAAPRVRPATAAPRAPRAAARRRTRAANGSGGKDRLRRRLSERLRLRRRRLLRRLGRRRRLLGRRPRSFHFSGEADQARPPGAGRRRAQRRLPRPRRRQQHPGIRRRNRAATNAPPRWRRSRPSTGPCSAATGTKSATPTSRPNNVEQIKLLAEKSPQLKGKSCADVLSGLTPGAPGTKAARHAGRRRRQLQDRRRHRLRHLLGHRRQGLRLRAQIGRRELEADRRSRRPRSRSASASAASGGPQPRLARRSRRPARGPARPRPA